MLIPLLLLLGTLLPLLFLNRWLSRHIQGLGLLLGGSADVAILVYFILMLPGIVLHELSHWLMAKLLGLRTGKIAIWPARARNGKVRLGSVQVAKADPLRESLVGVAPLLAGTGLILLIGALAFNLRTLSQSLAIGDWRWFFSLLGSSLKVADFWLWLYVIFTVSNAMLPSESDRRAWLPLGIFLAVLAGVLIVLGWTPDISPAVSDRAVGAAQYLGLAFLLTLLVDLFFMGLIAGLEALLSWATGQRVSY